MIYIEEQDDGHCVRITEILADGHTYALGFTVPVDGIDPHAFWLKIGNLIHAMDRRKSTVLTELVK